MDISSIALRKLTLQELQPDLNNVVVVGVIIAKQRPRTFAPKRNEFGNRAVWNFTLRDSPRDYINATFWGACEEVLKLSDTFQIGDVGMKL